MPSCTGWTLLKARPTTAVSKHSKTISYIETVNQMKKQRIHSGKGGKRLLWLSGVSGYEECYRSCNHARSRGLHPLWTTTKTKERKVLHILRELKDRQAEATTCTFTPYLAYSEPWRLFPWPLMSEFTVTTSCSNTWETFLWPKGHFIEKGRKKMVHWRISFYNVQRHDST